MAEERDFWQQFNRQTATLARIDERQTTMSRDITRLLDADATFQAQREADREWKRKIEERLQAIEASGITAWSWRKLTQAVALISAAAVLLAFIFEFARWFAAHWK
jgi:hypothetical protein